MPSARVAVVAVAVLILVAPLCGAATATAGPPRSKCQLQGKFDCMNGKCISGANWCDGVDHCGNNLDETSCRICLSGALKCKSSNQCVPPGARCNGIVECLDQSDELGCEGFVTERSAVPTSAVATSAVATSTSTMSTSAASGPVLYLLLLTMAVFVLIR